MDDATDPDVVAAAISATLGDEGASAIDEIIDAVVNKKASFAESIAAELSDSGNSSTAGLFLDKVESNNLPKKKGKTTTEATKKGKTTTNGKFKSAWLKLKTTM